MLAAQKGFERLEARKQLLQQDIMTNLWLMVNLRVHLRANEGEQTHPVSFS